VGRILERGQAFADRYEILGTVGQGGMGVVYRARDRHLDEVVALKLLRAEALANEPTLLERFKQEIRLARRITHRNVLRTHDFGEANGVPFISMEYLEGVTLKELVRSRGALPLGVALSFAKQMCHGLEAAHAQGVVHRDIKPHNMLILPESGELKIMDFGIARPPQIGGQDPALTTAGTVMGTPDYMSPEQAQGRPADSRADIYSLGVVLFEALTGKLPFQGETATQVVIAHVQQPPPSPRSLNPRLPPRLDAAVLRCLEKDPARRWQKVDDLAEVLSAVSTGVSAA
jgi:serine/threonine-protein kinase